MKPILLIHGFGGGKYEYRPLIKHLRQNGFKKFYQFTYKKKFGQVPVKEIAKQLNTYVKKNIKERSIDIVSFSQGGIIAKYFLKEFNKLKVDRCITLCSPHKGSWTAYLLPSKGIADLRPESRLLTQLQKAKLNTKFYSVYNPLDLMVFPGTNAKLKNNKKVYALLHQLTFWKKETLLYICEILDDKI